jgi:hypothetical protein
MKERFVTDYDSKPVKIFFGFIVCTLLSSCDFSTSSPKTLSLSCDAKGTEGKYGNLSKYPLVEANFTKEGVLYYQSLTAFDDYTVTSKPKIKGLTIEFTAEDEKFSVDYNGEDSPSYKIPKGKCYVYYSEQSVQDNSRVIKVLEANNIKSKQTTSDCITTVEEKFSNDNQPDTLTTDGSCDYTQYVNPDILKSQDDQEEYGRGLK